MVSNNNLTYGLVALLLRTLGLASAWIAGDGAAYILAIRSAGAQKCKRFDR